MAGVQAAGDTRAYALVYRRRRWVHAVQIASGDQLQPDFHVACASPRFCEAVDTNGFAVRYDGHRIWLEPAGRATDRAGAGRGLLPGETFCAAVGAGKVMTLHRRVMTLTLHRTGHP